jgi:hypothetical protein
MTEKLVRDNHRSIHSIYSSVPRVRQSSEIGEPETVVESTSAPPKTPQSAEANEPATMIELAPAPLTLTPDQIYGEQHSCIPSHFNARSARSPISRLNENTIW